MVMLCLTKDYAPRMECTQEDTDWIKLEIFLGMDSVTAYTFGYRGNDEGYRLKSDDSDYWNWQGSDEVGFDALNGGHRSSSGTFHDSFHKAFFLDKNVIVEWPCIPSEA